MPVVPIVSNLNKPENDFTLVKPTGSLYYLNAGDIIKAEVIKVMETSEVTLRLMFPKGGQEIINAKSEANIKQGEKLNLKVLTNGSEIRLQLINNQSELDKINNLQKTILDKFIQLSSAKLNNTDIKDIRQMILKMPENIKSIFPEILKLEKIIPDIEKVNANVLKESVENSGVALETKLKIIANNDKFKESGSFSSPQIIENDVKAVLYKIKEDLNSGNLSEYLKSVGIDEKIFSDKINRFFKTVEFYQASSKLDEQFFTYLPINWKELKESELSFSKNEDTNGVKSYTCNINLDLDNLGVIKISTTYYQNAFYISFTTNNKNTESLIIKEKYFLEDRFKEQKMNLKAVNIINKEIQDVTEILKNNHRLDVKV